MPYLPIFSVHGFTDSEKTTIYQYCVLYLHIQFHDAENSLMGQSHTFL